LAREVGGSPCSKTSIYKFLHKARTRHANVNALNNNPIDSHDEDEDFGMEIQNEKKDANVV
jgi:hypothetical protein